MRRPRLHLPGIPLHLTQRGVNRAATFIDEDDFASYRQALRECSRDQEVNVHGYVLMTNHVHLLVSSERDGAISRMMQAVGRRYVRAFNLKHRRTGTLWEGRYKSCLVDSDRYFLACLRYIELNPVRAAMVVEPLQYRWCSVHAHCGAGHDSLLTPHPIYLALGANPTARADSYRHHLSVAITSEDLQAIRQHLQQERALGSPRFQAMVAATLNRPVAVRPPGRPKSTRPSNSSGYVL